MKQFKRVASTILAIVLMVTACLQYNLGSRAAEAGTPAETDVSAIWSGHNGEIITFQLTNSDWDCGGQTAVTPGSTYADYTFYDQIQIYYDDGTGEKSVSLRNAHFNQIYYNMWGGTEYQNTLSIQLNSAYYPYATKIVIPAGTIFPSFAYTGSTASAGTSSSMNGYTVMEDIVFVGTTNASSKTQWTRAKATAVETVKFDLQNETARRLVFNIAGDADNDALPNWCYIGSTVHDTYNTKDYVQIYIKGETTPKTLRDYYKTSDGNMYWNLYEAGSMTFPLLDDFSDATAVEKIVIKKGCEFPSVAYTKASDPVGGGEISATTGTRTAYVVQEDVTFVINEDATATSASFTFTDTSTTTATAVTGVKTGHSNKNVTFTLSTTDYAGCATNRPSMKYADYNFLDMVQIHSGETMQTLKAVYVTGDEIYYNLHGAENTFTIALGTSYDTVTKIVIPAGTVFPSADYTGYGAWDATSIPDNMVRNKGGFETTKDIVYVKPEGTGELIWTVEEKISSTADTTVDTLKINNGKMTFQLVGDTDNDELTESYVYWHDTDNIYNVKEQVEIYFNNGKEKVTLADVFPEKENVWWNLFEQGTISFAVENLDCTTIEKIVVKKSCAFPAIASTGGAVFGTDSVISPTLSGYKAYVVNEDLTFVPGNSTTTDVSFVFKDTSTTTDTKVTGITTGHNDVLAISLSTHDYAVCGGNSKIGEKYADYNFLEKIIVYSGDSSSSLKEAYAASVRKEKYYNLDGANGTIGIDIGSLKDTATKIVIPAGTVFPSATYTGYDVWNAASVPDNMLRNKGGFETTEDFIFEIVSEPTEITNIHVRGGNSDYRLMLFLSNNDYAKQVDVDFSKLLGYNTLDNIVLYDVNGKEYLLNDIDTEKAYYRSWTDADSIGYGINNENLPVITKVLVKAGCEFPSMSYTNGLDVTRKLIYVVEEDTLFTVGTVPSDNGFTIQWNRTIPRTIETTVKQVSCEDGILGLALEDSDYGTVQEVMGEAHIDYGYLEKIRVYTTDTDFVTLEEALGSGTAYFNANNTLEFTISSSPVRIVIPSYTVFPTKAHVNGTVGEMSGYEIPNEQIFELTDGVWMDVSVGVSRTYGDANGDDDISSLDLVRMKHYFKDGYGMNNFGNCDDDTAVNEKDIVLLRKAIVGSYTLHPYVKESNNLTYFASQDASLDFFLNDFFKRHAGYVDYIEGEMTATTYRPGEAFEGMFNTQWLMEASTWYSSKGFDIDAAESLKGWLSTVPVDKYGYVWNGNDTIEDSNTDLEDAKHAMGWPIPNANNANAEFTEDNGIFSGDDKSVYWDFNNGFTDGEEQECIWTNNINATVANGLYTGTAFEQSEVYFEVEDKADLLGRKYSIVQAQYSPWLAIDLRMTMDDLSAIDDIYIWYTTSNSDTYNDTKKISVKDTAPIWYEMSGTDYAHMLYVPMYTMDTWYSGDGTSAKEGANSIYKIKIQIVPREGSTLSGTFALNYVRPSFDTRYSNNNALYISTVKEYYSMTGDTQFLKEYITKARKAMNFLMQMYDKNEKLNNQSYLFGHYGSTTELCDGMVNGYWDVTYTPVYDFQSNMYFYEALRDLTYLENALTEAGITVSDSATISTATIGGIGTSEYSYDLEQVTSDVLAAIHETFWNGTRFVAGKHTDETEADNGHVVWNLQAIESGIATEEQAASIMNWIDSDENMYQHGLAPMTNTIDNASSDMYSSLYPHTSMSGNGIGAFGQNVQNGGAVMYSSYYDLISRLKVNGTDDAYKRLAAICDWYLPIAKAYDYNTEEATDFYYNYFNEQGEVNYYLQNGNRGNGNGVIGLDGEFPESLLAVAAVPHGFFGTESISVDCLGITPALPEDLQHWKIENMEFHNVKYDVSLFKGIVRVDSVQGDTDGLTIQIALDYVEGQKVYVNEVETTDYTVDAENGKAIVTVDFDDVIVEVR